MCVLKPGWKQFLLRTLLKHVHVYIAIVQLTPTLSLPIFFLFYWTFHWLWRHWLSSMIPPQYQTLLVCGDHWSSGPPAVINVNWAFHCWWLQCHNNIFMTLASAAIVPTPTPMEECNYSDIFLHPNFNHLYPLQNKT